MFCGLLGGNFSKKCKQAVKLIKMRIEHIKRKKQVVVYILKKDIADLIAGGRKANAFKRVDALIVEMNLASCYEMIEGFCDCIMNQLPILQKIKDCPEEAMEAVSTLIFAAARFPDLPELCDLRSLFAERYGNCTESSVNPQFAEKTRNKIFSKQKKLELMENIAAEFDRPNQEEINGCNLTTSVELEPKEIHVISTNKTSDSCDLKDIEACENPKILTEEQHEMDCSSVEKEVISIKTWYAYVANRRVPPCTKPDSMDETDNEKVHGGSDATDLKNQLEKELNKNRRGRYLNPPYRIQPKIHDTSNEDELHIEKPMPLALDHVATKDEEEMALDKLLQHYSRKGTDTEPTELDDGGAVRKVPPPQRTFSLPHEPSSPSEAKTHVRGKSLQSDPLSPKPGRVHPRLPDYDQLVARFAAMKHGRGATIPRVI